ncbi:MAG: NUDIX hydrolase [Acidobacteriota bacterium]
MPEHRIRALALGVFRRGDAILVGEGYDPIKDQIFYRPLGGGIEFGEHSLVALHREMQEEIGAEIKNARLLGTVENIFVFNGVPGHEIIQIYEAEFVDESFYAQASFVVNEGPLIGKALWMSLGDFQNGATPLYPDGLLSLLTKNL